MKRSQAAASCATLVTLSQSQLVPHRPLEMHVDSIPGQVASAGLTEQEARRSGVEYVVALRSYADVAYGWALEDTTSFVKLLVDPNKRTLLGEHIIGLRPRASCSRWCRR